MKNIKTWAVLVFAVFILAGCNEKGSNYSDNKESAPPNTTTSGTSNDLTMPQDRSGTTQVSYEQEKQIQVQDRLIVRNGSMNIEVDSYDETEKKIEGIVNSLNGYIVTSNSNSNTSGKKQGTIAIKVPAEKYDELLNKMPEYGKVMSQNISSTDVTEEYIDLEARMKTQKELETRLLELLNNKTGGLTDVLEVESKLAEVRQKIESTEGRMNFLKKQASYSTLSLSIFEPSLLTTSSGGGFFYEIGEAFKKGLDGFTEVLSVLITVVIALIPLWIFVLILILALRWFLKKRKARQPITTPAP